MVYWYESDLILSMLLLASSGQLVAVYRLQQRRTRRVWFTGPSNSVTKKTNPKKIGSQWISADAMAMRKS
jgi:hypothetical protein